MVHMTANVRSSSKRSAGLAGCVLVCATACFTLACAGELSGNEEDYFANRSALPGSGGSASGSGGSSSAAGCDRISAIIDRNCKACHSGNTPLGELDLVSPGVEGRLVDEPSSAAECASLKRVDSASPADSFLLEKLTSSDPACGDPMPYGSTLAQEDIECFRAWVTELAGGGS